MFRSRSWFGGGWGRPKNPHSLEHLKYLYNVLSRNQTVSEHNRGLLVETLRSIAEILIWGDQNDSSVFDFFLEKNMLSFFLRIMRQRSGGSSFVCVQLLQTLNILFENIRNETSLYYLLSNNHVNSIIVHKFDFSDEEVMAYYISFLKTLSLKLNAHTIHFFYNEHTNDFPLYTEAIKFFNHPESMVRIAVRTLTLNVYKVEDASMLAFIRDRTAAPYFSNIVWFIGKHIQELDACVRNDADHQSQNRLADLVAEHLDHLHYLNDILCLNITDLNRVLTDHLLHKLLIPMYICSLAPQHKRTNDSVSQSVSQTVAKILNQHRSPEGSPKLESSNGKVSCVVALFLLSQVFLIISHAPLVQTLAWIILKTDRSVFEKGVDVLLQSYENERRKSVVEEQQEEGECSSSDNLVEDNTNITDEEKQRLAITPTDGNLEKPFLETVYNALDCTENDYVALFALSLLYAMANNKGVASSVIEQVVKPKKSFISKTTSATSKDVRYSYNSHLVDKLLNIITLTCQPSCRVRLVTLELGLKLFLDIVMCDGKNILLDGHRTLIDAAKTQSTALLRNFYKSEEIFLDMFEHEYCDMSKGSLNVEWLCMDSAILLPPTGTPMTGIDFTKRLPCGEVERAKRAIRVFFLVRNAVLQLNGEIETQLPLTNPQSCVQIDQALDLSISHNSDLIACTVTWKDGTKMRRFLVIDVLQLILVEPDSKRLGWGVAKLVGFLQDIEVTGDKDDSRCLHITIHRPISGATTNRIPLLNAKFVFDDNIRCMAAKQRLTKGRLKARQKKMQHIARLLDIPGQSGPPSPAFAGGGLYARNTGRGSRERPLYNVPKVPGFAAPRRESSPGVLHKAEDKRHREGASPNRLTNLKKETNGRKDARSRENSTNRTRSREGSPRMPRPRSEEIPLELIKKAPNSCLDMAPKISILPRPQTPRVEGEASTSAVEGQNSTEVKDTAKQLNISSEETSFIGKKKGLVETI
ncbi:protein CLEC16A homolog isoform X2 [Aethina tumida]|uniref:protein CLEC16A homolog isoform X2 n=1 Tax=Aethina tumida TaxID=116153 RepID=UPI00214891FC|nr:protein CLEC16A homolog isoform X2 [Aethina tumida]